MKNLVGTWEHELSYSGMNVKTILTLQEDRTFETHMIYRMSGGCIQNIYHYGKFEVSSDSLRLKFESGTTEKIGCQDSSQNFEMRNFTEEETNEARSLLAEPIPYTVEGNTLTTTVRGPVGEMKVIYKQKAS